MNMAGLLELSEQLEAKWDGRMAGRGSRPYRELLGYVGGRLLGAGADPADVVGYFHELVSLLAPMFNRGPDPAGPTKGDA